MSVHTRTHLINSTSRVIEKRSSVSKRKKGTPWRNVFRKSISKHSEPGLMIRGGRAKEGWTQKELADRLNILPHHISEMEHGKRSVSKKMAQKLGKLFKVDYRVFL